MDDGPIIVFSDTHFGFEAASARRFQNFVLNWLAPLVYTGSKKITSNEGEKTLEAPSKIILIGDILELLAPRNCDPTLPLRESFDIFNSLVALKREIIYVSGNHDEDVGSYRDGELTYVSDSHDGEAASYRNETHCEGDYAFKNGCQLTVYSDHYPVHGSDKLGKKIGAKTYYFFHGHQFDSFWRLRFARKFGDFVAQSSAGIRYWKLFNVSGPVILLGTVILSVALAPPLSIDWLSRLAGLVSLPGVILISLVWGFFLFLSVIWIFSRLTQWYYHSTCPGYPSRLRNVGIEVIARIARREFTREMDTINADVIVFGHTHVPEKCHVKGTNKQLANCGSWITYRDPKSNCGWIDRVRLAVNRSKSQKSQKDNVHDTFVYICRDRDEPLLLQWDDDKSRVLELRTKEHCLEH